MSKASTPTEKPERRAETASNDSTPFAPMKRHPALFYALLAVYLLWMAALVAMYFATVQKNAVHSPAPASLPAPVPQGG